MLREIFSRFKPRMFTGIDGLNMKILKVCESELTKTLIIHLINNSIRSKFEIAKGSSTLSQKGGYGMVKNCRPISLLPNVSKFIESTIYCVWPAYLLPQSENGLLSDTQYGLMKFK